MGIPHRFHSSTSILSDVNKSFGDKKEPGSKPSWRTLNSLYLILITIFEAAVVIALEAVVFARFKMTLADRPQNDRETSTNAGLSKGIPVYLMIFILSLLFQVGLVWDAVRQKNTIQIIAFLLFNLCCFSYGIFQFKQIANALEQSLGESNLVIHSLQNIMVATPVIIGVCQLIYMYLGTRLYLEFGWRIYKKIGADPDMRNMYRWYQIFLTILKLDLFFFLGFSIQFLALVLKRGDAEFALTIIALPFTVVIIVLAVYAIHHESKYLILSFFIGLAAGVSYFIFKIIRMYDHNEAFKYEFVRYMLTFFASVTLFLLLLTAINAAICWSNFGKGIKDHLLNDVPMKYNTSEENVNGRPLSLD